MDHAWNLSLAILAFLAKFFEIQNSGNKSWFLSWGGHFLKTDCWEQHFFFDTKFITNTKFRKIAPGMAVALACLGAFIDGGDIEYQYFISWKQTNLGLLLLVSSLSIGLAVL